MNIQDQNFGVEIELTGITRENAAKVIADHFGTVDTNYEGGCYSTYTARDTKGRTWKCMRDGSIYCTRKSEGRQMSASSSYSCELVTPILQYEDIESLQEIVRELVKNGAVANETCGIHIHVDGANHTPESLTTLMEFSIGRQDLFYEALQIGERANRWCKKSNKELLKVMKNAKDNYELANAWYSSANDGYRGGISSEHYNETRYHGINLHAYFTKHTVEFRLFNGTTHAGKIKAYIQFCLAMSAWAINHQGERLYFKPISHYTTEQKLNIMNRVLVNRLGMKGKEFKTARFHLTKAFQPVTIERAA